MDPKLLLYMASWIMAKCDDIDIFTGQPKPPSQSCPGHGHTEKMRAALTHKFGRDFQLGSQQWIENPAYPGRYIGNPSISVVVGQYMVSLRRRKVCAGDVVTSACAMKALYDYNKGFPRLAHEAYSKKRKAEHPEEWAGFVIRMMLQLQYIVSMLCLLRYDETLRIMWTDVTFEVDKDGQYIVRLCLPFRKTHQNGGICPFILYANCDKPWMCPVRAFAIWWHLMNEMQCEFTGYIFRKCVGRDGISKAPLDAMVSVRSYTFLLTTHSVRTVFGDVP
ncbi:hypothetical protein EUX98_g7632 [Antrodiella citrinella]|uniref:Uncharacterized protein n=1 Tax=Antrodiella citrinella TaxID=2447956 RepID=A0A4S4MT86_9APHY|nr:hypothetical protein EUX98_g7632 [Antrodiella citrinella]